MGHSWRMKGKFENQEWIHDFEKDIATVIIKMKCLGCTETKKVKFVSTDFYNDWKPDLLIVNSRSVKK